MQGDLCKYSSSCTGTLLGAGRSICTHTKLSSSANVSPKVRQLRLFINSHGLLCLSSPWAGITSSSSCASAGTGTLPFYEPSACPSWAGRATQAELQCNHRRAVLADRKGIHKRWGPGQHVLGFKMENIQTPLSIALEFPFTPTCNLFESVSFFQCGKLYVLCVCMCRCVNTVT